MKISKRILAVILLLPLIAFPQIFGQKKSNKRASQQAVVKIQKTSLTRDDEIKLGNEAAAEVERTMEVVNNPQAEAWLNKIGQRLAQTPQANAYPYHFKIVNDDSINAFALPGGPMFVHSGLIKSADNESEVAGVLAHEMSHIALRHGAAQMSKAQTWQTIMGVVGAAAGMAGGNSCGLLCQAVQMGGGLGVNSLLMRFSRDHEHDADLNGARMMAAAGYNPIELPHFFEKLQAKVGTAGEPKGLSLFMASHPATGSRIQYVSEDIQFYPPAQYDFTAGGFDSAKQAMSTLPPAKKKPAALLQAGAQGSARQGIPQGFKDLGTQGFAVAYPSDWQGGQAQAGGSIYLAPPGGLNQPQGGGAELILGAAIDYYQPSHKADLQATTNEYLQSLKQGDANMRVESPRQVQLGGKPALMTRLTTKTSNQQEPDQVVYLYTAVQGDFLWNMALAAPASQLTQLDPIFQQIAGTVQFH